MLIPDKKWIDSFKYFSLKNNAAFQLHKSPSMGYHSEYLTCSISFPYKDTVIILKQQGIRSNVDVKLSFICLGYEYKNCENLSLALNQSDFLGRLFSRGSLKTGSDRFDRAFIISTSDRVLALKIFGEKRVQELFLGNRFLLFNVQTKNGITKILLKSMERKLYSPDELQKMHADFLFMLNQLF